MKQKPQMFELRRKAMGIAKSSKPIPRVEKAIHKILDLLDGLVDQPKLDEIR